MPKHKKHKHRLQINQTTGDIIWSLGEFGNFTFLSGNNDYENNTNHDDCPSSLMEATLNETSMIA